MISVFVLTVSECGELSVEGVFSTAQSAAATVARDYDSDDDRFLSAAEDLDNWDTDEDSPDTISFVHRELGPGIEWCIKRMILESSDTWENARIVRDTEEIET